MARSSSSRRVPSPSPAARMGLIRSPARGAVRPPVSAAGIAFLLGALAACVSDRPAATAPELPVGGDAVSIENFAYVPPNLSVASGTTVTWTNTDQVQHTVSSDDGQDRKSTRLNSSHVEISYAVFCLKKKK